jgi:two-component system, response regulator PdtaR
MTKILIVDDNVAFAENLAEIICDTGREAVVADSGARALELAERHRFDALVSDMRMPAMSGTDVLRRVRHIDAGLPALIVSAYSVEGDIDVAMRAGVLGVLPKPVPMARLLKLLGAARRHGVVAIVDDDRALVENLSEILRDHGYSPVAASSVAEAESLADVPLFAAIVDLRLPDGPDGEAMRRLAARFPALPMVVATGYADVPPPVPANATLLKPIKPESLVAQIDALHAAHAST